MKKGTFTVKAKINLVSMLIITVFLLITSFLIMQINTINKDYQDILIHLKWVSESKEMIAGMTQELHTYTYYVNKREEVDLQSSITPLKEIVYQLIEDSKEEELAD